MKNKTILFVCRHNVFRSQVAEEFFNRFNKNKKYRAMSAGLISYKKEDLKNDKGYKSIKKVGEKFGLRFRGKSKSINSSILKKIDLIIIVADDIPHDMFNNENVSMGKVLVWKVRDIRKNDKDMEKIAYNSIIHIEKKVKKLVRKLK